MERKIQHRRERRWRRFILGRKMIKEMMVICDKINCERWRTRLT